MKINKNDLLRIIASTEGNEINLVEIIPNNVKILRVGYDEEILDGFYKRDDGSVVIIESSEELDLTEELVRLDSLPSLIKNSSNFHELSTRGKLNDPMSDAKFELSNIDLEVKPLKSVSEEGSFNVKYYSLLKDDFVEKELIIPSKHYGREWKYRINHKSEEQLKSVIKRTIGVFDGKICEDYYDSSYLSMGTSDKMRCTYIIKNILPRTNIYSSSILPRILYSIYQLGIGINYIFVLMTRDKVLDEDYLDLTVAELESVFNERFLDTLSDAYRLDDDEIRSFIEYLDYCRYNLINSKSNLTLRELIKEKEMFDY